MKMNLETFMLSLNVNVHAMLIPAINLIKHPPSRQIHPDAKQAATIALGALRNAHNKESWCLIRGSTPDSKQQHRHPTAEPSSS